jgi:hypothetical protein
MAAAAFRTLCEEGCGRTEDDEKALEVERRYLLLQWRWVR